MRQFKNLYPGYRLGSARAFSGLIPRRLMGRGFTRVWAVHGIDRFSISKTGRLLNHRVDRHARWRTDHAIPQP